jgi:hypothetical protein
MDRSDPFLPAVLMAHAARSLAAPLDTWLSNLSILRYAGALWVLPARNAPIAKAAAATAASAEGPWRSLKDTWRAGSQGVRTAGSHDAATIDSCLRGLSG